MIKVPNVERDVRLGRIRRVPDLPEKEAGHVAYIGKKGKSFHLPASSGSGTSMFYRVGRWTKIPDFSPSYRNIIGLASDPSRPDAFIHLIEWKLPTSITEHEFRDAMDSQDNMSAELSEVILAHWQYEELSYNGHILEFRKAWSRPSAEHSLPWRMAVSVVELCHIQASILILKAFPLEYEHIGAADSSPTSLALKSRQRAMQRLYSRMLGVNPFEGADGEEGWMWRKLPNSLIEPQIGYGSQ